MLKVNYTIIIYSFKKPLNRELSCFMIAIANLSQVAASSDKTSMFGKYFDA